MRLLIVDDDAKTASFIKNKLSQKGFVVDHATHGEDGLHYFVTQEYDIAVIDIMLPRMNGLDLINIIRQKKINTPVLILSAKNTINDKVHGIQIGGDDYMVKPFAFSELLVRVQALIRRSCRYSQSTTLTFGNLTMDLLKRKVYRGEKMIDLRLQEFSLLEYFMRNPGIPLSKTLIMEKIWDYSFDPKTNVVDVLVCRLRNKIDKDFSDKLIRTIRGVGYVLENDQNCNR